MKKVTMAVCDVQDTYRERLAEYLLHKRAGQLKVYAFSSRKQLLEEEQRTDFDIVLFGKGFERTVTQEKPGSLWIYLSEEPTWSAEQEPAVFKYQSAEEILRIAFEYYLKLEKMDDSVCRRKKEVIGVYSPTRSRMQTPFALTMAQMLAEEKRVLYVNMGEWSGLGVWLDQEYRRDLADLMYLISDYGNQVQGILESVVHSVNRMDYIPPMADAQLLCQVGQEDYQALLTLLVEKTDYEVILLDFGVMVPGFFRLLERCSRIYGVIDQGALALGQCRQFEAGMIKRGAEQLAEKMEYVPFSMADMQAIEEEPALSRWLYGVLGDRARAVRYIDYGAN